MKTDSIFYRLFQEFPNIFFELIGEPLEAANVYKFSSIEVKQTAFRIDGVFLPKQEGDYPFYFVEVQFQVDLQIYARLFAEICLYLRQNQPVNNWRAVVIYPTRSLDTADIKHYHEFFTSQRVSRLYLEDLGETGTLPISIATVKLVIEDEDTAIEQARSLINRTKQEINLTQQQQQLLQLIETILVYKFPNMSRKEIEEMFKLSDLKQTRVYQEAFDEGVQKERFRTVSLLLKLGRTVEEVAQELELSIEEVRRVIEQQTSNEGEGVN
ncbi:flagellar assembly protein H [Scytonema hofmannii PCC 7110]|uniref:Flagellar assembly protein H n=1 Tax=Scytonema hofmannii PCC 7110 TaxID=128403 RepID=A0A139X998_9CYAN|nr:Rpn family recombination-promoting nuclease/putative transposase [Scytonema hofmannii]KYC41246.1 flagellar assembly protein H [Scytonema hofmannii PCC 7110]